VKKLSFRDALVGTAIPVLFILVTSSVPVGSTEAASSVADSGQSLSATGEATVIVTKPFWAGYVQLSRTPGTFTYVDAEWYVPKVDTKVPGKQYSGAWVGIDGTTVRDKLVQAGTASNNVDGKAEYEAWSETLPNPAVSADLDIHAGDLMMVTIHEESANLWGITITDKTSGETYNRSVRYTTPGKSAEAIFERPKVDGQESTLATTSSIGFTVLVATGPHVAQTITPIGGTVNGATLIRIFMSDSTIGKALASPSVLPFGSSCFTVADGSSPPTLPDEC
jgi:hypothetical protein